MSLAASEAGPSRWRPNVRLWLIAATGVAAAVALGAIGEWRDRHVLLVNTTHSLPNWAFVIDRARRPDRGDYVFFDPPASALVRRHFGPKPQIFGKIVYGLPGDIVDHRGDQVTVNNRPVARMKPYTRSGERLTPGPTGKVPHGCYFAATPHQDGFDSRYAEIGLVCARQIVGIGEPVL